MFNKTKEMLDNIYENINTALLSNKQKQFVLAELDKLYASLIEKSKINFLPLLQQLLVFIPEVTSNIRNIHKNASKGR